MPGMPCLQVPVEKIVEVPVEHVVEKVVEVPVERVIEKVVKIPVPVPGPTRENIIYRYPLSLCWFRCTVCL